MSVSEPDRMLTVSEVAEILSVSPRTVRRHIEAGHFPEAQNVGVGDVPRYRIPANAVDRFREEIE